MESKVLDFIFNWKDNVVIWANSFLTFDFATISREEIEIFIEKWMNLDEVKQLKNWQEALKFMYWFNNLNFYEEVYKLREICDKYGLNFNYFINIERIKKSYENEKIFREKSKKDEKKWLIYIIKASWKYKIWKTKKLKNRVWKYITENPGEIEIIHNFKALDYHEKERELHERFKDKNINREWFELDEKDLEIIKSFSDEF